MQTTLDRRTNQQRHADTVPCLKRAIRALNNALEQQKVPYGDGELELAGQIHEIVDQLKAIAEAGQRYSELPD